MVMFDFQMERFPVNQQTSSSKTHYPSGSESIAGPTDQEGHQGEDEQPTNQHKSMCYEGTSLTGPPVNKTRGRPRRSRGPVEGGKQILGKRNLEAMVVSLTEQNDSQLAKKQNKVQTGTAAEEKTSNKDNMREGGQTSTYLTRRKTKENESTEILHAPLRCLQTRQKGKPKKEMSKSVSATVVVRKSSPRRLVPEGPETAAMDADTQEPLTVGLSDQDSDSEGEEVRASLHLYLVPLASLAYLALTCSRGEDDLGCRHCVKPPLTHLLLFLILLLISFLFLFLIDSVYSCNFWL